MALPKTGTISMSQVRTELKSSGAISLGDKAVRSLAGKASGTISMNDLHGKSSILHMSGYVDVVIGKNPAFGTTKYGFSSLFGGGTAGSIKTNTTGITIMDIGALHGADGNSRTNAYLKHPNFDPRKKYTLVYEVPSLFYKVTFPATSPTNANILQFAINSNNPYDQLKLSEGKTVRFNLTVDEVK